MKRSLLAAGNLATRFFLSDLIVDVFDLAGIEGADPVLDRAGETQFRGAGLSSFHFHEVLQLLPRADFSPDRVINLCQEMFFAGEYFRSAGRPVRGKHEF